MADQKQKDAVRVDGKRLELVLERRGMTLKTLANKLDMHYNSLLNIKRTGSTTTATITRICDVLSCHPFDILVAEGYPEPFSLAPASH
jgi:DNA-binding Xre family transcriptional regulator